METFEREKVLYEISMSIGNSLEIELMSKEFLSTLLKKLTITTAAIIREGSEVSIEDVVFSIPRRISKNQGYINVFEAINSSEFKTISSFNSEMRYIFRLGEFGYLVVFSVKELTSLIVQSLEPLLQKLTVALISCDNHAELKKSLLLAQEARKAKESFMANMSHELRTPLNAIIGFSSILTRKLENEKHKDFSRKIATSSQSLLGLINDILDLSKIQNPNFTIEKYEFNAYNEMLGLWDQFEGLTANKTLVFENRLSESLKGIFFADWMRINQICLNLLSNAVKFTPKDGNVVFSGEYANGFLIMSVSDNGIGMSLEAQDKIFQPFQQADGSTTRKYGGTGLGLSITQNLVELMHGKIELESQEGEGTTLKITIPLEKLEDSLVEEDTLDLEVGDKENTLAGHILISEDNKTNQMLITILIESFGLTCDIANDGLETVEIYSPDIHALVLMDENMPNMNGIEAMKILQEKHRDRCTPIVALTANAMAGDKERFLKLGMNGYLAKPIDEDELYRILKEFLVLRG
ncbi:MAG: ATP-binding protein [Campylobacterota bacterium]|nr:ATP-binding protein [Campylobacterota bacterium]